MIKLTQSEIILNVLEENNEEWLPSYKIIKTNTKWGWLGTSADRFARWLAEDNLIERKREGKYVYYRLPHKQGQLKLL